MAYSRIPRRCRCPMRSPSTPPSRGILSPSLRHCWPPSMHPRGARSFQGRYSMDSPDLQASQNFITRELSFLEFNQRVLAQAFDEAVPLLERLRFLCISSSNLDEFFEIRVAGIKQLLELGSTTIGADGLGLPEQLSAIHARAKELVRDQYACLNDVLLPALREAGIDVLDAEDWDTQTRAWGEHHFAAEVEPVLS